MKKYFKLIGLIFTCFSLTFTSCEKDVVKPMNISYLYVLEDLEALLPIDLNFDGIENVDLSKEIDIIQYKSPIGCSISFSTTNDTLIITWFEPLAEYNPFLMQEIPVVYEGEVKYSMVPRKYTYWINHEQSIIYIKDVVEGTKNYYTFSGLTALIVDKEQNTIKFPFTFAAQHFLTKDGLKHRGLKAVFKPYPEDNYLE